MEICNGCYTILDENGLCNWCDKDSYKSIREWDSSHYNIDSLFVKRLRKRGLSEKHILDVLNIINSTCTECWDSNSDCYCMRDD